MTSAPLYPNMYVFIVGHPGVGKTRAITAAKRFLNELKDFHFAPTSMSGASLIDALLECKRTIIRMPDTPLEYNSMFISADEISAFMHKYDDEIIGNLTTLYDVVVPYSQSRRTKDLRIRIKHPQVSILSGTTPSNLLDFMPENAWAQGFTSRIVMVFSDERIHVDDIFANTSRDLPQEMLHDLRLINSLVGEFKVTQDYKNAVNNWRKLGQTPVPQHPRLTHYNTRRLAHLLKLSMVASVDKSNTLLLTTDDFNSAMGWLLEAEQTMADIFTAGRSGGDAKAMDEIFYFVSAQGKVSEHKLIQFASERLPSHAILRALDIMERSGRLHVINLDTKTGMRTWAIPPKDQS